MKTNLIYASIDEIRTYPYILDSRQAVPAPSVAAYTSTST
jgi:hypothetical protein